MAEPVYRLAVSEVAAAMDTGIESGLSEAQVRARQLRDGPNSLPPRGQRGALRRWLDQLRSPLVIVLLAAAGITVAIGEYVDAGVIVAVVVLNAVVGFGQESKARRALDALTRLVNTSCAVVRAGRRTRVPSQDLVAGDMVILEAGDRVPADGRVVAARELHCDESALTGESVPVGKTTAALVSEAPVADRVNMVFSATMVTRGSGRVVVTAIGASTEIGTVERLVAAAAAPLTPLTRKLARFSRRLTVLIAAVAAATFGIGLARGTAPVDMFMAAVALAVGAIPEGLPAAVTVVLAIGVVRMARRNAIVRQLPAVETLGSTTVICSDKTGTMTANALTVAEVYAGGETYAVTGTGFAPDGAVHHRGGPVELPRHPALGECLVTGVLCNDAELYRDGTAGGWRAVGDPTEVALLTVAAKAGLDTESVRRDAPRLDLLPFDSHRRLMATLHTEPGGVVTGRVKGAAEQVLTLCRDALSASGELIPLDSAVMLEHAHTLAAAGLRVLACARFTPPADAGTLSEDLLSGCTLLGLIAMADLPRHGVANAVRACHDAGIAVKMITGDHPETARAIATKIGLTADGADPVVVSGSELPTRSGSDAAGTLLQADVFARVSPEQKLRLVEALQRRGQVVAMTGDGVNDAPALRQADIGVAMGDAGTEVARDAADMALADDNFATIEAAVEEGRAVFDNLRKFITWTLPTNIGEGLVILTAVIFGTTLPILPVQILWINMTTAGFLGLTLAFERAEPGIMNRPPRPPSRPLITRDLLRRILLVASLLVAGAFAVFAAQRGAGASEAAARTAAINVFVFAEIAFLISCRSFDRVLPRAPNRWLYGGIAAMTLLQLAITYTPVMQSLFHTAPIGAAAWGLVAVVAAVTYGAVEADKALWRRHDRHAQFSQQQGRLDRVSVT